MLKLALLATLASLLVHRLRPRSSRAPEVLDDGVHVDVPETVREMVQDPVCGTFIGKSQALSTVAGGRLTFFCSGGCYRRFLVGPSEAVERSA